jgi:hypothetical protein
MAYDFVSANTQYLSTTNPVSAAPFTIACWAWVNNISSTKALVSLNQNSGTNRFVMSVAHAILRFGDSGTGGAIATGTVAANTWFHACAVEASTTSRFCYRDGANAGQNTTFRNPTLINALNIGTTINTGSITQLLAGRIAEVGIWNAALTAEEVASLAQGMTCEKIRPQSLVFYAPLVRNLIDQKSGLTITNNNGATVTQHPRVYA